MDCLQCRLRTIHGPRRSGAVAQSSAQGAARLPGTISKAQGRGTRIQMIGIEVFLECGDSRGGRTARLFQLWSGVSILTHRRPVRSYHEDGILTAPTVATGVWTFSSALPCGQSMNSLRL